VTVVFTPTTASHEDGTLSIVNNAVGSPLIITITGVGIPWTGTGVSGVVSSNTTWTSNGSPYIVIGDILIENGVTLTIEPSVTVKMDTGKYLKVEGQLIARGTIDSLITFESSQVVPSNNDWDGIKIRPSGGSTFDASMNYSSGSELKYVQIKHSSRGLYIFDTGFLISYSEFTNNQKAIEIRSTDSIKIDYCTFSNNDQGLYSEYSDNTGDYVGDIVNTYIQNNTFTNNTYGVDLISNQRDFNNLNIKQNVFSHNSTAIEFGGGGYGPKIVSVYIDENKIINNSSGLVIGTIYGLSDSGTEPTNPINIRDNIVVENTNNSISLSGVSSSVNCLIQGNVIFNNGAGLTFSGRNGGHTVNKNQLLSNGNGIRIGGSSNNIIFTNNCFTLVAEWPLINIEYGSGYIFNGNNYPSTSNYIMKNNTTSNVNAEGNYWGDTTLVGIDNIIYDYYDDFERGIVDYIPFLVSLDTAAPILPPRNVVKTASGSNVQLTWAANRESDFVGYKVYYGSPTGHSFTNVVDVENVTSFILNGASVLDTIAVTAYDSQADGTDDQIEGHESWFKYAGNPVPEIALSINSIGFNVVEIGQNSGNFGVIRTPIPV